jgi:hypothetical protein
MRGYLGILICAVVVLAVIVGLSAAGSVQFDRPPETESNPVRSSYNAGPTGTRAFYQFLEESGVGVSHWRENYLTLKRRNQNGILIVIGPFQIRISCRTPNRGLQPVDRSGDTRSSSAVLPSPALTILDRTAEHRSSFDR